MELGTDPSGLEIAVIGMAGRFPGAPSVESLWANLCAATGSIHFFSERELLEAGVSPELFESSGYVRARGVLADIELFDADFFRIPLREAEVMDPQHRLFLECAWEALEHAGLDPKRCAHAVGVYAGAGMTRYLLANLGVRTELLEQVGQRQLGIGNDKDFLATRVSYKLGLRGPSITVQTACSTSLVAVHLACQGLLTGDCDVAIAGGVSLKIPQQSGYRYQPGGIESPDGHCRAFDARAEGTVSGSGVGAVVLKRLADALRDRDGIHAVIRGSAINNDGSMKAGYTAPSIEGQAEVIERALARAGLDPRSIGYIEAHGTGTPLGDPIEVASLRRVFERATHDRGFCALGSIKPSIGHLDVAAGIAGLIKTVLCLRERAIPASLDFEIPNPALELEKSAFFVNDRLRPWPRTAWPRRAGVSSFGIGGTNAHVVLEEAPPIQRPELPVRAEILVLSARSEPALDAAAGRLADRLERSDAPYLPDVAFTLQEGRAEMEWRLAAVAGPGAPAASVLRDRRHQRRSRVTAASEAGFLLAGSELADPAFSLGLYRRLASFRDTVDRASAALARTIGGDLRALVFSAGASPEPEPRLPLAMVQAAHVVLQLALARSWECLGVEPVGMFGHGIGELASACLAGVLDESSALELAGQRGVFMQTAPAGAMLTVDLSEEQVQARLGDDLDLAAINSSRQCVVAGPLGAIRAFEDAAGREGVGVRWLSSSHAFHSRAMDRAAEAFARACERHGFTPAKAPFVSSLTGRWITESQAIDPTYWARQLREPLRIGAGIETLRARASVLIELGAGSVIGRIAGARTVAGTSDAVIASLDGSVPCAEQGADFLAAAGAAWVHGVPIRWSALHEDCVPLRVPLPGHPLQRKRHWIDAVSPRSPQASERGESAECAGQSEGIGDVGSERTTELLAEMWKQVLGQAPESVDEDFFEAGGESLAAVQLLSRIRDRFDVQLPMEAIFESPTVAGLTVAVASAQEEREELQRLLQEIEGLDPDAVARALVSEEPAESPMDEGTDA